MRNDSFGDSEGRRASVLIMDHEIAAGRADSPIRLVERATLFLPYPYAILYNRGTCCESQKGSSAVRVPFVFRTKGHRTRVFQGFLVYFPRLRFLEGTPDSSFIVLGGTTCLFSNQGMIPLPGSVYNTQLRDKIIKGLWKWEDQCQDPVHRPTTITAHMGLIQSAVTVSEFSRSGICRVSEKCASGTFAKGLCCHCFVKQATHNGTRNDWAWEDLFIADYCKSHYYPVIHPCG